MEVLLLVLLMGTWGAMAWLYRHGRAIGAAPASTPEAQTRPALAMEGVVGLIDELEAVTNELGQALEARAARLRALLDEADRRMAEGPSPPGAGAAPHPPPASLHRAAGPRLPRSASEREDEGQEERYLPSAAVNELRGAWLPGSPVAGGAAGRDAGRADEAGEEVVRLAAEGLDIGTIARQTGRGREEVRLRLKVAELAQGVMRP